MNSMAFSPKEKEQCSKFIKTLIETEGEDTYCDIHITSDGYCTIVEWNQLPFDGSYGAKFTEMEESDVIYTEVYLPDRTYIYVPKEEKEKAFQDWLDENPGWIKSEYGIWTQKSENNI